MTADPTRVRAIAWDQRPRRVPPGSALLLAVLVLLLVDCIVIGTIQLARLEQRLAAAAVDALRLRLAAEAAAATVLAGWPAAADSLAPGEPPLVLSVAVVEPGHDVDATLEALPGGTYLLRARVRQTAPRTGAATAVRLTRGPALPGHVDPAPAALSVPLLLEATGAITAATVECDAEPRPALRVADPAMVESSTAVIDGGIDPLDEAAALTRHIENISAVGASAYTRIEQRDFVLDVPFYGVLIVEGDLVIAPGGEARGLVVVAGDLIVPAGGLVAGAAHAGGSARIDGSVRRDACLVEQVVRAAGLRRPHVLRHRPAVAGW